MEDLTQVYLEIYKGRHGQSDAEYQAGRSDAGKRISGDEKTGPNYYTKGRSRGATPDAPTAPGAKPVNTPKLSASEKEYHQYNKSGAKSRAEYNKVGGSKGLPGSVREEVAEYLFVEGYADTIEAAELMAESIGEAWVESILEAVDWNKSEVGITGKPIPKKNLSAKNRHEFEKKRRENLKKQPGTPGDSPLIQAMRQRAQDTGNYAN